MSRRAARVRRRRSALRRVERRLRVLQAMGDVPWSLLGEAFGLLDRQRELRRVAR